MSQGTLTRYLRMNKVVRCGKCHKEGIIQGLVRHPLQEILFGKGGKGLI